MGTRKNCAAALFGIVLGALPLSASAGFVTGNELSTWDAARNRVEARSGGPTDFQDAASFFGYVIGVFDTIILDVPALNSCFGDTLRAKQMMNVVSLYLTAHPEQWTESGSKIVTVAIVEACTKRSSGR